MHTASRTWGPSPPSCSVSEVALAPSSLGAGRVLLEPWGVGCQVVFACVHPVWRAFWPCSPQSGQAGSKQQLYH